MEKTCATYDIRLTGSSQTIVTQGRSGTTCSSGRSATAVPPAGVTEGVPVSDTPPIIAGTGADPGASLRPTGGLVPWRV
ncbi:hypothetical protein GCM10022197_28300 [Microlunatus spumicola]|uniref:Uncharacterized protein n=1 Tax=Microlunatus spumicola TaxID=81499 RepID=A0ABP6XQX3_9ACTN